MTSRIRPRSTAGFTIIEMLIVVTILALLAGILLPVLENEAAIARDARRAADLKSISGALIQYRQDNGTFPDTGGAWQGDAGNFGSFGYDAGGYIPGLVPDYLVFGTLTTQSSDVALNSRERRYRMSMEMIDSRTGQLVAKESGSLTKAYLN